MPRRKLDLAQVVADPGAQARACMSEDLVEDLAHAIAAGEELDDLDVVGDGETYHVWDGHHRLAAYRRAGVTQAWCQVQPGTLGDARWLACSANTGPRALRRSNEDKRKAVGMALAQRPDLGDGPIADHCGVSDEMVRQVRAGQVPTVGTSEATKRTGRDGKEYPTRAAQPVAVQAAERLEAAPSHTAPAEILTVCRELLRRGVPPGLLAGALRQLADRVERGEM